MLERERFSIMIDRKLDKSITIENRSQTLHHFHVHNTFLVIRAALVVTVFRISIIPRSNSNHSPFFAPTNRNLASTSCKKFSSTRSSSPSNLFYVVNQIFHSTRATRTGRKRTRSLIMIAKVVRTRRQPPFISISFLHSTPCRLSHQTII